MTCPPPESYAAPCPGPSPRSTRKSRGAPTTPLSPSRSRERPAATVDTTFAETLSVQAALADPPLTESPLTMPPATDPALDDAELACARAALAQGRRQAARSLLARTGDAWDRRAHRITVLALGPYAAAHAHAWLLAEPGCADAAVLLALAHVRRALRGKETPATARAACRTAAEAAPADPTPGSAC